jgi:hypothetical protein
MTDTPKASCAVCGRVPEGSTRHLTNEHGRVLCQACVEEAVALFRSAGLRFAGDAPPAVVHAEGRCCLCGKPPNPDDAFVVNAPHGTACAACIDECHALVLERRADIAWEEDAPDDAHLDEAVARDGPPRTIEEVQAYLQQALRPGYFARARLSKRQREILLRTLLPLDDGTPGPAITGGELADLVPAVAAFRAYVGDRLKPLMVLVKEQERVAADAPLTPADRAAILCAATPGLLAPLGAAGTGPALLGSFLARLAARVETGEPAEVRDTLQALFAPEFRDPVINERAADPARDGLLVTSLVRPTLARIKAAETAVRVVHGGRTFLVRLVIESAERSHGPVKQPYRIAALVLQDHSASLAAPSERPRMLALLEHAITERGIAEALRTEPLAPFAPLIERAVASVAAERGVAPARLRLAAVSAVVGALLTILADDEKTWLITAVLGLSVRGLPPPRDWAPGQTFDDGFLSAVVIPSRGAPRDDATFLWALRLRDSLTFSEKVLLVTAYVLAPTVEARTALRMQVDRPVLAGPDSVPAPATPPDLASLLALRASSIVDLTLVFERWLTPALSRAFQGDATRATVPLWPWR